MSPDDHLDLVGLQELGSLDMAVVVRARSHLVGDPAIMLFVDGVTPQDVAKGSMIGYFHEPIDLLNVGCIVISLPKTFTLGEMPP